MNIFRVLSKGDGSVQEPNVTSVLTYFFDPQENHGMGSVFLESFLKHLFKNEEIEEEIELDEKFGAFIEKNINKKNANYLQTNVDFSISVDSEVRISISNDKDTGVRDVDILIEIKKVITNETHLIVIENKIKDSSFVSNQLSDIHSYYDKIYNEEYYQSINYLLFLPEKRVDLNEKYPNLDKFTQLVYKGFFTTLFKTILEQESIGEIPPINEYSKLFLKSFNQFILNDFTFKENYNYSKVKKVVIKFIDKTEKTFEDSGLLKESVHFLLKLLLKQCNNKSEEFNDIKIGSFQAILTEKEFNKFLEDKKGNYEQKNPNKDTTSYMDKLKNRYQKPEEFSHYFCTQISSSGNKPNIIPFMEVVKMRLKDKVEEITMIDENDIKITF